MSPDGEPLDFEDIAIRHLAKRARKIRMYVGLCATVLGLLAGQATAWLVLDAFEVLPAVIYGALFLGPLLLFLIAGRNTAKSLIRRRAKPWSEEMAEQYQLNPAQLRSYIHHM